MTVLSPSRRIMAETGTERSFPAPILESEWILVWEDDFSGNTLDETKWQHCPEWDRCNGECKWSDQDAYVDGEGNLVLSVTRRDERIRVGAVRTKGLYEETFCYFEIRCRVPVIKGGWCAFWMMPANGMHVGDGGRDGAEIDIFESIMAERDLVSHALHWDGYGEESGEDVHIMQNRPDVYEGFHTYAVLWNEEEYVFYIDDVETWRTNSGGVMQVPAYMKITLEAAGWSGNISEEELPKYMIVDYVRVYKQRELADQHMDSQ